MTPTPEAEADSEGARRPNEGIRGGRYVVVGSLGAGSQGETLDAMDKREGRPVAIKRFMVRGARSWKDVELAEREAAVLSSLSHPGLPRYIEHFEENGALYLVMEKVEGETLAARRKRGQALSREQVVRFLTEVAGCLRYLHGHAPPIVHRDIKPGNVILRPDGSYCLVDFGSVRDRLKPEGGSTVVGTFGFMAPEQFQGRALPRSDVYAVGATAICLLTGSEPEDLPHKGLGIDVEAALGGQVDRRLTAALRSMLEANPDVRAGSVDEALERAGLLGAATSAGEPVAEASKGAPKTRWDTGAAATRELDQAEERVRRVLEEQRKRLEQQSEWQQRHQGKRESRRERKARKRDARRAERHAMRYAAAGQWRRPGRLVPPGLVLGIVLLVALHVASVATFALFSVLLPLLFTILSMPRRRERMLEIGRTGQRGLTKAREHIRYQFLGGPTPSDLGAFLRVSETEPPPEDQPPPRVRVIDAEAEERELEAERWAAEAEMREERSRRGR